MINHCFGTHILKWNSFNRLYFTWNIVLVHHCLLLDKTALSLTCRITYLCNKHLYGSTTCYCMKSADPNANFHKTLDMLNYS